jgi:hypothetical protein
MTIISVKVRENFANAETLGELKGAYVDAMKKYSKPSMISQIDALYCKYFDEVKTVNRTKDGSLYEASTPETASYFLNAIHTLKGIEGIDFKVVGSWMWVLDVVKGATKENREAIKSAGCHFAGGKKMWYLAPPKAKKTSKHYKFEEIEEMYS